MTAAVPVAHQLPETQAIAWRFCLRMLFDDRREWIPPSRPATESAGGRLRARHRQIALSFQRSRG